MRLSGTKANSTNQYRGLGDQLYDLGGARPTLDLNFANNESLVDSVTGKNLITHTRASSATYADGDGVIKSAVTNLILQSEDFSSSWVTSSSSVTANETVAPNGTLTADKVIVSSPNLSVRQTVSGSFAANSTYTVSVYIKAEGSNIGKVVKVGLRRGDTSALQQAYNEVTLTGDWQRVSQSITWTLARTAVVFDIRTDGTSGTPATEFLVWGAQLEESSAPGEYVKTTSTINSAPRFDHNPATGESLGLLVEEARQNRLIRSKFDTGGTLAGATRTLTTEINPAGEAETRRLQCTADTNAHRISYGSSSSNTVTVSAFVKKDTHRYVNIGYGGLSNSFTALFDIEPGLTSDRLLGQGIKGDASNNTNVSAGYQDYPNGWVRIWATGTTTGSNGISVQLAENATAFSVANWTADGTEAIYVWGGQLEDDAAFPTSLNHTDGSMVTRAADVTEITGNDFGTFNLFNYSEEWHKRGLQSGAAVKLNQIVSPVGTMAADLLYGTTSSIPYYTGNVNITSGRQYTFSVYLKAATTSGAPCSTLFYGASFNSGGSNIEVHWNLSTGLPENISSGLTASMTDVGNGWYRCQVTVTATTTSANAGSQWIRMQSPISDVYAWGAQFEESSTVTPYVKSDVTFTSRASTATYYDYNGVIRTAAVDEARNVAFLPDGVTGNFVSAGELLLEEARTNLVTYSEDFSNWTNNPNRTTITVNAATAPNGTNTADKLIPNTDNATHFLFQKIATITGTISTFSVYAKAAEFDKLNLLMGLGGFGVSVEASYDLTSGTSTITASGTNTTSSITNVGNGWYRCVLSSEATSNAHPQHQVRVADESGNTSFSGDDVKGLFTWGAQVEHSPYPTSYIPTSGATATRAADVSSSSSNTFGNSFYKQSELTVYMQWYNHVVRQWTAYYGLAYFRDSAASHTHSMSANAGNGHQIYWSAKYNGVNQLDYANYAPGSPSVPEGTFSHAYALATDDAALASGGTIRGTDSSITMPETVDRITFDAPIHIKRLTFWPQRLPDATLQTITN